MVCSSALPIHSVGIYELHVLRPFQTYRIFERDMLEGGGKGAQTTLPHLIIEHEKKVVEDQSGPADHHILTEDSDLTADWWVSVGKDPHGH